jgi:hypothetical protein
MPHEETWTWKSDAVGMSRLILDLPTGWRFIGAHDGDKDRIRLAAAAPEMARMLLWLNTYRGAGHDRQDGEAECIVCHATWWERPDDHPDPTPTGWLHAPDCALVAVLRKAGVLE